MGVNISRDQVAEMIYESAMFKLWKWTLRTSREVEILNEECRRDEFRRKCETAMQKPAIK